jgi:autotransporter adhesin
LDYVGVAYDITCSDIYDLGGGAYSGTAVSLELDFLSAIGLDFTGRTIWADVSGITRTENLIITNNPVIGNVWTCIDTEGRGYWSPSSGSSGSSIWELSTGVPSAVLVGSGSLASGNFSVAEGSGTTASGTASHAEGYLTTASANYSHAQGWLTKAIGDYGAHAEGFGSTASGLFGSHAEGYQTAARGNHSHAEGSQSIASGETSHAEGYQTQAYGNISHTEGLSTTARGVSSHAEGGFTLASGDTSHAEGYFTIASGLYSHAEGWLTMASGAVSHAEGYRTTASGSTAHAEGELTTAATTSHAEGQSTTAIGLASHSQNYFTAALANFSHAGGSYSTASGVTSFVHGNSSIAGGSATIVLGNSITGTSNNTTYVDNLNIKTIGAGPGTSIAVDGTGQVVYTTSDLRLKENISTLTNALDKVKNLRGVTFQLKDRNAGGDDFRIGFIAQEVNEVIPELTFVNKTIPEEYMGVHYDNVTALLVEAIKEIASGSTTIINDVLNTQTVVAEDNNIDLNFGGTQQTAIDGGIRVLHAKGVDLSSDFILDANGDWTTNNDFKPNQITIPLFTPSGSTDTTGNLGNITRDDTYIYVKCSDGWKRSNLESF